MLNTKEASLLISLKKIFTADFIEKMFTAKLMSKRPTGRSKTFGVRRSAFGVWRSAFEMFAISPIPARPLNRVPQFLAEILVLTLVNLSFSFRKIFMTFSFQSCRDYGTNARNCHTLQMLSVFFLIEKHSN